jgi:hypothetical protein
LDDVGFVGYQERRSAAEIKKDAARTARHIKAYKAKRSSTPKKPVPVK